MGLSSASSTRTPTAQAGARRSSSTGRAGSGGSDAAAASDRRQDPLGQGRAPQRLDQIAGEAARALRSSISPPLLGGEQHQGRTDRLGQRDPGRQEPGRSTPRSACRCAGHAPGRRRPRPVRRRPRSGCCFRRRCAPRRRWARPPAPSAPPAAQSGGRRSAKRQWEARPSNQNSSRPPAGAVQADGAAYARRQPPRTMAEGSRPVPSSRAPVGPRRARHIPRRCGRALRRARPVRYRAR